MMMTKYFTIQKNNNNNNNNNNIFITRILVIINDYNLIILKFKTIYFHQKS